LSSYGFYHPDRGYWQTVRDALLHEVTRHEVETEDGGVQVIEHDPMKARLAEYPTGTINVPLRPSADHHWQGGEWVYIAPPTPVSDLSPARFAWLLAFTGLGEVWDAMEAATKDSDRAVYAGLVARRASRFFTLADTLAAVTLFAPLAAQVAPEVDLSEAAIRAAWAQAETAEI
jgi:hypothetical protein